MLSILLAVSALGLLLAFARIHDFGRRALVFAALTVTAVLTLFSVARDYQLPVADLSLLAAVATPVTVVLVWLAQRLQYRLRHAEDDASDREPAGHTDA